MKLAASHFAPASDAEALRSLQAALPADVPSDYFEFLACHDGAEFTFDDVDWERDGYDSIRPFSVQEMLRMRRDNWISEALPALVVIGSDSGGQFLAYDASAGAPWPLVMYCPGAVAAKARTPVAVSITDLRQRYGTR
jgi:hypothetical protein